MRFRIIAVFAFYLAASLGLGTAMAQDSATFQIGGEVVPSCVLAHDCSGGQCTSLNMSDISAAQDTAVLKLMCNFSGSQTVVVTSSGGGKLSNGTAEVVYTANFSGAGDTSGDIATGLVGEFTLQANTPSDRTMQVQLTAAAPESGQYRDTITATISPLSF